MTTIQFRGKKYYEGDIGGVQLGIYRSNNGDIGHIIKLNIFDWGCQKALDNCKTIECNSPIKVVLEGDCTWVKSNLAIVVSGIVFSSNVKNNICGSGDYETPEMNDRNIKAYCLEVAKRAQPTGLDINKIASSRYSVFKISVDKKLYELSVTGDPKALVAIQVNGDASMVDGMDNVTSRLWARRR